MANIPQDLRYTKDHEYVRPSGDPNVVIVGITDFAQGELGDVVFVDLPKVGRKVSEHDVFGTIEAVKAVSELYTPLAGEVAEVNARLDAEPSLVNSDPYGDGWMIKLKVASSDSASLLDADSYKKLIGQ